MNTKVSSTTVWEVNGDTGSPANGGGFNPFAANSGVDRTFGPNQSAVTRTDIAVDASSKLTSATTPFTSGDIGNVIQIGGGGSTAGLYELTAVGGANQATLLNYADTNLTGVSGTLGGAFQNVDFAFNAMIPSNTVWIKKASSSYSYSAVLAPSGGVSGSPSLVIGYGSVRGDGQTVTDYSKCAKISLNGSATTINMNQTYARCYNLYLDNVNNVNIGFTLAAGNTYIRNCFINRFAARAVSLAGGPSNAEYCMATSGVSSLGAFYVAAQNSLANYCVAENNSCAGFMFGSKGILNHCISKNNIDGITLNGNFGDIFNCICYKNTGHGILLNGAGSDGTLISNCILSDNSGYGIYNNTSSWKLYDNDYNGYFNNGSGAIFNIPTGVHEVFMSSSPFTSAGTNNFTLNNTAGAGALLRGSGNPGVLNYVIGTGYSDIGVYQHQDAGSGVTVSGGSTNLIIHPGMGGGMRG